MSEKNILRISSEDSSFKKLVDWLFECHTPYKKENILFNNDTIFIVQEKKRITFRLTNLFRNENKEEFLDLLSIYNKKGPIGYFFRSLFTRKNCDSLSLEDIRKILLSSKMKNNALVENFEREIKCERITYSYILDILCFDDSVTLDSDFYYKKREEVIEKNFNLNVLKFETRLFISDNCLEENRENLFDLYDFLKNYIEMEPEDFHMKIFHKKSKKDVFSKNINVLFSSHIDILKILKQRTGSL